MTAAHEGGMRWFRKRCKGGPHPQSHLSARMVEWRSDDSYGQAHYICDHCGASWYSLVMPLGRA